MAGDLNVVKCSYEKWSADERAAGTVGDELENAINSCHLVDHHYVRPVFTWSNGHVFYKLDRVLVNQC